MLEATFFLQKFPETRNRNRYLFSGKISETRAQGKTQVPCYLVMGVTRVGTVCVVVCSGDEERRVRGTGGVCRSRGDRSGEPLGINILVQLPRGSFNVVGATMVQGSCGVFYEIWWGFL